MKTHMLTKKQTTGYTPVQPLQAVFDCCMSQDAIATAEILINTESITPLGVFQNPNSNNIAGNAQAEALAIVALANEHGATQDTLCHVARSSASESGWALVQPDAFASYTPAEVSSGTTYAGTSYAQVYGFFQDGKKTYVTQLDDTNSWSEPAELYKEAVTSLKSAYTPSGALVLYGTTNTGDLYTAYQESIGGSFTSCVCDLDGALTGAVPGDFQLCLLEDLNGKHQPWQLAVRHNQKPLIYQGNLGEKTPTTSGAPDNFSGKIAQIVLGYYSSSQHVLMYLFVPEGGGLQVWSTNAGTGVTTTIPNSSVAQATGFVDANGLLHVYSIDEAEGLWVLHQSSSTPWNTDGTPNWSPYIPLDTGVASVICDGNPADAPSLFAVDASQGALRLHTQDPTTAMWKACTLQQAAQTVYEVTRFRTEVNLIDANGFPCTNYDVTLQVNENYSAASVEVLTQSTLVDSSQPVSFTTDAMGKFTFSILASAGLAAPAFTLAAEGLTDALTIQPAAPVHDYLSGAGPLNLTNPGGPLDTFDASGKTLQGATVNGQPLAPGVTGSKNKKLAAAAAQAISNTAAVGLGQSDPALVGYALDLRDRSNPSIHHFATRAEMEAYARKAGHLTNNGSSDWSEIEAWAGDVWDGIKNGVVQVEHAVVDVANQIATFTVTVGDWIADGVSLAIQGLEQAASFIAGVFQSIEAAIEDVIDWLKAMFDFTAIWNTKEALEQAVNAFPGYVQQAVALWSGSINNWFSQQEDSFNTAIDTFSKKYGNQTFGQQAYWQPVGSPPSTQPQFGNASPADSSNNVHNNWFTNKITAHAPAAAPYSASSDLQQAVSTFCAAAASPTTTFQNALGTLQNDLNAIIQDPKQLGDLLISDFVTAIQAVVDGLLTFCDAMTQAVLDVVGAVMEAFQTILTSSPNLGYLNTLWSWIAKQAGSSDTTLTLSGFFSLMMAFPGTLIYKLIEGADNEPFPDGTFPGVPTGSLMASNGTTAMPTSCLVMAGTLTGVSVVTQGLAVALGGSEESECPWWLSLFNFINSAAIWLLENGFVVLANLPWATIAFAALSLMMLSGVVFTTLEGTFALLVDFGASNFLLIMAVAFTAYGLIYLVLSMYWAVAGNPTPNLLTDFANIFDALPSAFQFLSLMEDEAAVLALYLITISGYGVAGGCMIANATTT